MYIILSFRTSYLKYMDILNPIVLYTVQDRLRSLTIDLLALYEKDYILYTLYHVYDTFIYTIYYIDVFSYEVV